MEVSGYCLSLRMEGDIYAWIWVYGAWLCSVPVNFYPLFWIISFIKNNRSKITGSESIHF